MHQHILRPAKRASQVETFFTSYKLSNLFVNSSNFNSINYQDFRKNFKERAQRQINPVGFYDNSKTTIYFKWLHCLRK